MVSFKVGAMTMQRWRPILLNLDAKSTRQQDCCDLYYNKRWHQVYRPWSRPLLINVYVNIQSIKTTDRQYSQQWCGLEDAILHLQLPIVY